MKNNNDTNINFKDSKSAFEEAIKAGTLSENESEINYAGNYMYMGTWDDKDHFKHIDTREYLSKCNLGQIQKLIKFFQYGLSQIFSKTPEKF